MNGNSPASRGTRNETIRCDGPATASPTTRHTPPLPPHRTPPELAAVATVSVSDVAALRRRHNLAAHVRPPSPTEADAAAAAALNKRQTVDEPCPAVGCEAKEVEFYTLQLRSADEGSTVFYECPQCGHRWNQNN